MNRTKQIEFGSSAQFDEASEHALNVSGEVTARKLESAYVDEFVVMFNV